MKWKKDMFGDKLEIKDRYFFHVVLEKDGNAKVFDFADEKACLHVGMEMVAIGVADGEEVRKACEETKKYKEVPEHILRKYGFSYDGFLHAWTKWSHTTKAELERMVKEILSKKS
jgi:hypothetical protein